MFQRNVCPININLLSQPELYICFQESSAVLCYSVTVSSTCSQVQSDSPQEVLVSHPVVVPHGQLQAPVGQLLHAELLPGEGLVPARGGRLPTDPCLLLPTAMTRQQISAIIKLISRLAGIAVSVTIMGWWLVGSYLKIYFAIKY